MHDATVDGRSRGGREIFFVAFALTDVVASMDVDVPESGEDQAVVRECFVGDSEMWTDSDDAITFDPDLSGDDLFGTDNSAGNQHGDLPWQENSAANRSLLRRGGENTLRCERLKSSRLSRALPFGDHLMDIKQVGPWEIGKKLGAGGMGAVYLGTHKETGKQAAVKVLPASLAREEGFVERFKREIASMEQLKSPHIVEFYESGSGGDIYYYSMEYVDGETLTSRLKRDKRMPWAEVIDLCLQICRALKAAHNFGIIHRDLKPSNLMLSSDGTVKLTDFGVAQVFALQKLTVTGGIVGTAEYMSPEQAKGQRTTKKSDLYSLGAVMYVMLTGRPPFSGKSSLDVIHKHQFGVFDRPSLYATDMPRQLEEIVCKLLEKEPDNRYPDSYVLSLRLAEVQKRYAWQNAQKSAEAALASGSAAPSAASVGDSTEAGGHARVDEDLPLAPTVLIPDALGQNIPLGATIPPSDVPAAPVHSPALGATMTSSASPRVEADSDATRHLAAPSQGPGTIMRNLMRKAISEQHDGGAISRAFDKTWVQVAALFLLVAGGVWWFRTRDLTAEEYLSKATVIANKDGTTLAEIGEAREYLDEALQQDRNREKDVDALKDRLNVLEMRNNLKRSRNKNEVAKASEPKRLLKLALQYSTVGDYAQAVRKLRALIALTRNQPEFRDIYTTANEMLNALLDERTERASSNWLPAALERADKLRKLGQTDDAIAIWRAIVELYADDPDAAEQVTQARTNLREVSETPAPTKVTTDETQKSETDSTPKAEVP